MAPRRSSSDVSRLARWSAGLRRRFPDRHIYIRSQAGVRGLVLTTGRQLGLLFACGALVGWTLAASLTLLLTDLRDHDQGRAVLAQRLTLERTAAARDGRLIAAAEDLARERTRRLRLVLGAAGVAPPDPAATAKSDAALLARETPATLAAILGVDEPLASRIRRAAQATAEARDLARLAGSTPLARPAPAVAASGDFGVRRDPFTGRPAFHPGVDIPAPLRTPIYATARGVVVFAGVRPGYGSTVEVDHGAGLITRFAHLASIVVRPGDVVDTHTELGDIGSTGRSTGPHLHYEIRRNGRPEDPGRYLKAGDYVQQAG
jgi:murein DD-endopeptidase MepM/ murein hydrolase activator NlpD